MLSSVRRRLLCKRGKAAEMRGLWCTASNNGNSRKPIVSSETNMLVHALIIATVGRQAFWTVPKHALDCVKQRPAAIIQHQPALAAAAAAGAMPPSHNHSEDRETMSFWKVPLNTSPQHVAKLVLPRIQLSHLPSDIHRCTEHLGKPLESCFHVL